MTARWRICRSIVLAVLVLGLAGVLASSGTLASFSDSHVGQASVTADTKFGGGGGPQADAGGPYTMNEGGWITLDGSGSSTPQGTITSYEWEMVNGPGGGWFFPVESWAFYIAPDDVNGPTQAVVRLTVTTNQGETDSDWATITIQNSSATTNSGSPPSPNRNAGGRSKGSTRQTFGNTSG